MFWKCDYPHNLLVLLRQKLKGIKRPGTESVSMRSSEYGYRAELETHLEGAFGGFRHLKQRQWGGRYVRGLMMDGARKSAGAMALYVPDGDAQALQQFVSDSPWDFLDVRRRLTEQAVAVFPRERYLIFDETGFPKQGKHSVGVARQYCGTLGKVGNCQVAVSLHLACRAASVPLDWDLYLPEVWIEDPERLRRAQVPAGTAFRTKGEIALAELDRVRGWGVGEYTVLADAGYGHSAEFRAGLTARGHRYVVAVQGSTGIWPGEVPGGPKVPRRRLGRPPTTWDYGDARPTLLEALAHALPAEAWEKVSWDYGADQKTSRFYRQLVHPAPRNFVHGAWPEPAEWLLIEWPDGQSEPEHYWLSTLDLDTSMEALVRTAKLRWRIELDYRQLKDELGLDHFEGRRWSGWQRHVTLVSVAYHFLVLQQLQGKKNG